MPDPRSRRDGPRGRRASRTWLLAFVVGMASAAIGGAAYSGGPAGASVRADAAAVAIADVAAGSASAGQPAFGAATLRGDVVVRPGVGAGGVGGGYEGVELAPRVAPGVAPEAAANTLTMDTPIQGGLTAHQEQAIGARLVSAHRSTPTEVLSQYWTPALGLSAVARAQSWLGMPYSWAGGNSIGPTAGQCDLGTGGDLDCHVVGFDCSGLVMYAWGPYESLPHLASAQQGAGAFHPTLAELLPGDLVFFSGYLPGGVGHVAVYAGDGMVIEAPQSGSVVRVSALADLLAGDGTYRGATRPLTAATPILTALTSTVSTSGGLVTLLGAHLAGVDAVHFGNVVIRQFVTHSDTAITFQAPAHVVGTIALTVSTSWLAQSKPAPLTFAAPTSAAPTTSAPATSSGSTTATPGSSTSAKSSAAPVSTTSGTSTSSASTSSAPSTAPSSAPAQGTSSGPTPHSAPATVAATTSAESAVAPNAAPATPSTPPSTASSASSSAG